MGFSSRLSTNEPIIDDNTDPNVYAAPSGFGRGLNLMLRGPEGYEGVASAFPEELLIPESEYQARIQELEERQSNISSISTLNDLPCKDQNGTNYCWINAPTHCVEIVRLIQNQERVILSPASAGAPIKNFSNVGGWGKEGLEYIIANGLVPVDRWPANAIDRRYYTPENREFAKRYRVIEWFELRPRDMRQLFSLLLRRISVALGYNWWGHEVTGVDVVWLDGEACLRIRNSWGMAWGERGFGILRGNKMLPDDAVAPAVAVA